MRDIVARILTVGFGVILGVATLLALKYSRDERK